MALLKYFKRIDPSKEERIQSVLPKSDYPLARIMPSSAWQYKLLIASAVYETILSLISAWVSVYAFIDSKLYGKA